MHRVAAALHTTSTHTQHQYMGNGSGFGGSGSGWGVGSSPHGTPLDRMPNTGNHGSSEGMDGSIQQEIGRPPPPSP